MSERNMYGCTECTECYSVYRYPVKEDGKYFIRCDDCGFKVDAEREGDYNWNPIRRCPHDDKTCKHECDEGECWRELNGS